MAKIEHALGGERQLLQQRVLVHELVDQRQLVRGVARALLELGIHRSPLCASSQCARHTTIAGNGSAVKVSFHHPSVNAAQLQRALRTLWHWATSHSLPFAQASNTYDNGREGQAAYLIAGEISRLVVKFSITRRSSSRSDKTAVIQKNNRAGGDIVGGNKTDNSRR